MGNLSKMKNNLKVITLEPTSICNQRCITCNNWKNISKQGFQDLRQELSSHHYVQLVNDAKKLGVEHINIAGGEPFLYKDILAVIGTVKSNFLECSLVTNGTLITDEKAKLLIDLKTDAIRISLDGHEVMHDTIRGRKGAFQKTIKGIIIIKKYLDKSNYLPELSFNTTINRLNIYEIPKIILLAYDLSVKKINFGFVLQTNSFDIKETEKKLGLMNAVSNQFSPIENSLLLDEKILQSTQEILQNGIELSKNLSIQTNIPFLLDILKHSSNITSGRYLAYHLFASQMPCEIPFKRLIIDHQGNVFPCSPIRIYLGNICKQSLLEIWEGNNLREFQDKLLNQKYFPICQSCCHYHRASSLI